MSLRTLCRCGHVTASHKPACGKCGCQAFTPAYPVYDAALPAGVVPVRDYSNGLTLVACHHAGADGRRCRFCHADPERTDGHRLPVKRLVFAPRELVLL